MAASLANAANRALDALFVGAQHDGCAWAADLAAAGATCRAARAEEALWAGLARVHRGPARRTALLYAVKTNDAARAAWLLARCC